MINNSHSSCPEIERSPCVLTVTMCVVMYRRARVQLLWRARSPDHGLPQAGGHPEQASFQHRPQGLPGQQRSRLLSLLLHLILLFHTSHDSFSMSREFENSFLTESLYLWLNHKWIYVYLKKIPCELNNSKGNVCGREFDLQYNFVNILSLSFTWCIFVIFSITPPAATTGIQYTCLFPFLS